MRKNRFSKEQIIAIPKGHSAEIAVAVICRKCGIGDATFYNRRSRYGGMGASATQRLNG
jgi:putative transposase